jgi:hypothetical protein
MQGHSPAEAAGMFAPTAQYADKGEVGIILADNKEF